MTDQTPRCTATDHGGCTPALCPDAAVTVLGLTRADAAPYDAGDAPTTTRPLPVRDEAHHLRQRIAVLDAQLADERRVTRLLRGTISRYVGDLTDAGAVVQAARDAVAVLDRALAVYDTAPAAPASERRECTALCRDIEADRDRLSADLARTAATLTREEQAHAEVEEDLHRARAELAHVGQVLTAWRASVTAGHTDEADQVLADLIDGGLLPTADQPMPPVALGSPADRAQGPSAAELLRQAAAGRREYARNIPEKAELLDLQASTLDDAAKVVDGELGPLYNWLPSWRWTDEMTTRLYTRHPADAAQPTTEAESDHDHTGGFPLFAPDATLHVHTARGPETWTGNRWNTHVAHAARLGRSIEERLVIHPTPISTTAGLTPGQATTES